MAPEDEGERIKRSKEPDERPPSALLRGLLALLIVSLVVFFVVRAPVDPPLDRFGQGGGLIDEEPADAAAPPPPPRCRAAEGSKGYRLGEVGPAVEEEGELRGLDPFAVEVGRGVALDDGFAVGVRRGRPDDGATATFSEVLLLDSEVSRGELVVLGRSRGDVDAPVVVKAASGWVAAMLEPNAGGLSVRLASVSDGSLKWGAELAQGRDESLAYDLVLSERVGVLAWDDVSKGGDRGTVVVAAVTVESLEGGEDAKVVSRPEVDADTPRLALRPGGFWLAYVARQLLKEDAEKHAPVEGRYAAERIDPSWIEVLPLDADGAPVGSPRPVTPETGHVLAYDLDAGSEGTAVIAWRDDDTPSGAQGGRVTTALVTLSGVGQTQVVADDDGVGMGVPSLVAGWLLLPDDAGLARLAPLGSDAQLLGELQQEPAIAAGQPLAGRDDLLLVARPAGKGVELVAVRCDRSVGVVVAP